MNYMTVNICLQYFLPMHYRKACLRRQQKRHNRDILETKNQGLQEDFTSRILVDSTNAAHKNEERKEGDKRSTYDKCPSDREGETKMGNGRNI